MTAPVICSTAPCRTCGRSKVALSAIAANSGKVVSAFAPSVADGWSLSVAAEADGADGVLLIRTAPAEVTDGQIGRVRSISAKAQARCPANTVGFSACGKCPSSGISRRAAPGTRAASSRVAAVGTE